MYRRPAPLADRHILDGFDSGRPSLDAFLIDMARFNHRQGYARTTVIADGDLRVVAYHALCAGVISRDAAPREVKAHGAPADIPVALLARLAVDRRHQGKGLGAALLQNALLSVIAASERVAFRAVMVHALNDAAIGFYSRYGFRPARGLERTLLLPVQDIVASFSGVDPAG